MIFSYSILVCHLFLARTLTDTLLNYIITSLDDMGSFLHFLFIILSIQPKHLHINEVLFSFLPMTNFH